MAPPNSEDALAGAEAVSRSAPPTSLRVALTPTIPIVQMRLLVTVQVNLKSFEGFYTILQSPYLCLRTQTVMKILNSIKRVRVTMFFHTQLK